MSKIEKTLKDMAKAPQNVRFADLAQVCVHYFGEPRNKATSAPRVNIQKGKGGKAKAYQVKQVLTAIKKLEQDQ